MSEGNYFTEEEKIERLERALKESQSREAELREALERFSQERTYVKNVKIVNGIEQGDTLTVNEIREIARKALASPKPAIPAKEIGLCGDCSKWMKRPDCPNEPGLGSGRHGPSAGSFGCDQFENAEWKRGGK